MYSKTNKLLNTLLINKQVNTCYIINNKLIKVSNTYNYIKQQFAKYNINTCYNKLLSVQHTQYALNLSNSKKHIKYAQAITTSIQNMFYVSKVFKNNTAQTVYNAYKYYFNTLNNTASCLNLQQRIIFKVLSNIF